MPTFTVRNIWVKEIWSLDFREKTSFPQSLSERILELSMTHSKLWVRIMPKPSKE